MSDFSVRISHISDRRPARVRGRVRFAAGLAMAIALVLAAAWADGGERALRPIAQPVDLPATLAPAGGQN